MQKPADGAAASQGRLVTGSTLGHVIRMTAAGSIGLVAAVPVTTGLAAALVVTSRHREIELPTPTWEDFAPE